MQVDMEEGEGIEIAKKHNVMIYPTYLILTPQDEKVGEIVGAEFNKTLFIEKLKAIIKIILDQWAKIPAKNWQRQPATAHGRFTGIFG